MEQQSTVLCTLENELRCAVCSDLIVFATTLNCMHTFCCYCIRRWMQNKLWPECPICRNKITWEKANLLVDNLVDIVTNVQSEEEKNCRKELVQHHKDLIKDTKEFLRWMSSLTTAGMLPAFSAILSPYHQTTNNNESEDSEAVANTIHPLLAQMMNPRRRVPSANSLSYLSSSSDLVSSDASSNNSSAVSVPVPVTALLPVTVPVPEVPVHVPIASSVRPRIFRPIVQLRRLQPANPRTLDKPRWRY